ncbi:hypothetical protein PMAYCL1PPCAC_25763, partial [Pristionchus mayeri]
FTCSGTSWIEEGATEVTCAYAAGAGELTMPAAPCMPIPELDPATLPPGMTTDYSQLIYTPYKDHYRATCKTGLLTIDDGSAPGEYLVVDCPGGMWSPPLQTATCVTSTETTKLMDCIDQMPDSTHATVSCKLGACTFTCANPAQQFQYTEIGGNGMLMKAQNLKCHEGMLTTTFLDPINFPPLCVN